MMNILDPARAPALELAALYHERWEIEGVFDEFKTRQPANSTVLRSKTPDLVLQELWGLLLAHFAIRQLMTQAAWPRALGPDRLSFAQAVRVITRKLLWRAQAPHISRRSAGAVRCLRGTAARADEPLRPAQPLQMAQAGLFSLPNQSRKSLQFAGVVLARFWRYDMDIHPVVAPPQISAYPPTKIYTHVLLYTHVLRLGGGAARSRLDNLGAAPAAYAVRSNAFGPTPAPSGAAFLVAAS